MNKGKSISLKKKYQKKKHSLKKRVKWDKGVKGGKTENQPNNETIATDVSINEQGQEQGQLQQQTQNPAINMDVKTQIVVQFLNMLNTVKLFHWNTTSFAQHKATDELYGSLNSNIDKFIEVLLGKKEDRMNLLEQNITLFNRYTTNDFKQKLYEYRDYLTGMENLLNQTTDTDLLNIRDEILSNINQTIYLFTLA